MLRATTDPASVGGAEVVVVVIGTPVDEHLNPDPQAVSPRWSTSSSSPPQETGSSSCCGAPCTPASTTTRRPCRHASSIVAGGRRVLPRAHRRRAGRWSSCTSYRRSLSSGNDSRRGTVVGGLFTAPHRRRVVRLSDPRRPSSQALLQFLALHQVRDRQPVLHGLCRERDRLRLIWNAITQDYPRMKGLPKAGFAAGPCLFKDTMQLAAFSERLHAGPRRHVGERGPTLVHGRSNGAPFDLASRRSACSGWPSKRNGRHSVVALVQAPPNPALQGRKGAVYRDHVTVEPVLLPSTDVIDRADILVVAAPHGRVPRCLRPARPVVDIGRSSCAGSVVACPSAHRSRSRPRVPRRRMEFARYSTGIFESVRAPVRGPGRRRRRGRQDRRRHERDLR